MFIQSRGKVSVQYETNRSTSFTLTWPLKAIVKFFISTDLFSTMFSGDTIESAPSARKSNGRQYTLYTHQHISKYSSTNSVRQPMYQVCCRTHQDYTIDSLYEAGPAWLGAGKDVFFSDLFSYRINPSRSLVCVDFRTFQTRAIDLYDDFASIQHARHCF